MKKTLALTLAVMALSVHAEDITFDYTKHGKEATAYPTASAPAVTSPTSVTVSGGSFSGINYLGNAVATPPIITDAGTVASSILTPKLVVKDKTRWTYTLSFSLAEDFETDSITVAMASVRYDNFNDTPSGAKVSHTLNLTGAGLGETGITTTLPTVTYGWKDIERYYEADLDEGTILHSSGAVVTFDLGGVKTLKANQTYTLALTVADGGTTNDLKDNYYLGLGGIQINAVPEPATATLSLLALAGLAARRRRK